jgi:uncharacterized repeat protein (TIGR03803 family)
VFELSAHSYSLTTLLGGPLMDSGVIIDAHGDLFGTTSTGGSTNDGTVYEILNNGTVGHPAYASSQTILASLNFFTGGSGSFGSLVADSHGDLFGTGLNGGAAGFGTVFEIINHGSAGHPAYASTPSVLVNFDGSGLGSKWRQSVRHSDHRQEG